MAQSSWLKPSFVTFKQGNLKSQLVDILESFTSFCASGMVPLASWGSGKGLIVFKVVLGYDDGQQRGGCVGVCWRSLCAVTAVCVGSWEQFPPRCSERRHLSEILKPQRVSSAVPTFLSHGAFSDPVSGLCWLVGERTGTHRPGAE